MNKMEEKFEIFYIRHGDTTGSGFDDRNECDIGLSELGEKQIELLGKRFKGKSFDAVFSSPLIRAVKTAAAVCNQLEIKPTIEIMPQIIENGSTYGYSGMGVQYLKKYYNNIKYNEDMPQILNIETDEDNDARARAVIKYFKSRFTYGQKILVVAHGSFGTHFLSQAVEMGAGNYILSQYNTGVSKIKYTTDGKQRISFSNDISHLREIVPNYEFDV